MSPGDSRSDPAAWQVEADLLADGRDRLERMCATRRYRHLFPGGPNLALLLRAYQQVERDRTVRREPLPAAPGHRPRRDRRRLRRCLDDLVRQDALGRDKRLLWHIPLATPLPLSTPPPRLVQLALAAVDADVRAEVEATLRGRLAREPDSPGRERGLAQLRAALINQALAHPAEIASLHAQYLDFTESPQPTRRRHPIATLFLVRLPLQLLAGLAAIFLLVYASAYFYFNDRRLGDFLTTSIGSVLDGELAFESAHWGPELIFDLITGRPHTIHCEGVRVYEGFKRDGLAKNRVTAYAEHLEVDLVLHEIIPWNRMGLRMPTEIPWILHFTRVRSHGAMAVDVREYQDRGGAWTLSLLQAFRPADDTPPVPGFRRLSIIVEDGQLPGLQLGLDFRPRGGWDADVDFDELAMELDYEGSVLEDPQPARIPFRYRVRGTASAGTMNLARLSPNTIAIEEMSALEVSGGMAGTPVGDTRITGDARLGGSPAHFDGHLRNVFGKEVAVEYRLATTNVGPIARLLLPEPESDRRPMFAGDGSPAAVHIEGPLNDVRMRAVGQDLMLDLFPEPAWAISDVDLSLVLARDPVPEPWRAYYSGRGEDAAANGPEGAPPERWIAYLETFRGAALGGRARLHGRGQQDLVVLPAVDEPLMASVHLDLEGIDPARAVPDDPSAAKLLAGKAHGGVHLHELSLLGGEGIGLSHAEVSLNGFRLRRSADDRLPRTLRADGNFNWDAETGLALHDAVVGTEGGELRLAGGFDVDFEQLLPTTLEAEVHDGPAFLAQFSTQPYFQRLRMDLGLAGRMPSPSGRGSLSISGAGGGGMSLGDLSGARLAMERGTLKIRAERAELLGGSGPLEVDLVLTEGARILEDPKLRVYVDLEGMDRRRLLGAPIDASGARLRLFVDDGNNHPVRMSKLQARGAASAQTLTISGVDYSNADAAFVFTREGLAVERLTLDYSRPLSPQLAPAVRVAVGTVEATGTIGFSADPELALQVDASGLPLSALTAFFAQEVAIEGKLAEGSRLAVGGTLRSPSVEGSLELVGIGVGGVPLGRGRVGFETRDAAAAVGPAGERMEARREIHVAGDFAGSRGADERGASLAWGVDGTVAFARAGRRQPEADVRVEFRALPISTLLHVPGGEPWIDAVEGQLEALHIDTLYCPADSRMLPACAARGRTSESQDEALSVKVGLEDFWLRPRPAAGDPSSPPTVARGDPCAGESALCSTRPLQAELFGNDLVVEPWQLRSGGGRNALLDLRGRFDLRPGEVAKDRPGPPGEDGERCIAGAIDRQQIRPGNGDARISGNLDLAALEAILRPLGIRAPRGQVLLDLAVKGRIGNPDVSGDIELAPSSGPIELRLAPAAADSQARRRTRRPRELPVTLSRASLHLQDGSLTADGVVTVGSEELRFGTIDGKPTFLEFAGPCRGSYGLAVQGAIDGRLPEILLPDAIVSSSGSATLERLHLAGRLQDLSAASDAPYFARLDADLTFGRRTTEVALDFDTFLVNGGRVQVKQCRVDDPCADSTTDLAVFVGGERGAASRSRPGTALTVGAGDRGSAAIWGDVRVDPRFRAVGESRLNASLSMFPFTMNDNSGRPELRAALSSERVALTTGDGGALRLGGKISVERSRWLRDATQGVRVLSFADPYPPSSEPLPPLLADLELDLSLDTSNPFTVDNNVFEDVEGFADLRLEGTMSAPELTGTLDVNRGTLDVDILGGAYDISKGRVVLDRDLTRSLVLLRAVRRDPVSIDGERHTLVMDLSGSLDAIEWECTALGDTSGELGTAEGCVDYLIFDAGNTAIAESDVTQRGQGDLLGNRFLPLAGRIAQIKVNDRLEEQLPQVERFLPEMVFRADQLGVVSDLHTRPEWLQWGWGGARLGVSYLSGYPGSVIRDSRDLTGRIDILEDTYLQFGWSVRNYSTRVLILDPPASGDFKIGRRLRIPSAR